MLMGFINQLIMEDKLPSGNVLQFAIEAMAHRKFVDLPINNGDFPLQTFTKGYIPDVNFE